MKYNGIAAKKLPAIDKKVSRLERWGITSLTMLQKSAMLQNATEHALQASVEAAIDTCERMLALENQLPSGSLAAAVEKVQELGIIPNNPDYIEMVKFRNFIAHRYEKVEL